MGTISRMGSKRKADLKFLDFVASEFSGNNMYVYESYVQNGKRVYKDANGFVKEAPNGMYMANGDIYIDLNAGMEGEGFVLNTFAHELTHHIRDWSPTKFKALADFLVKEYGKAGQSVDELVHARMAKSDLDYDAAFEEVVADSMEKMFADGNIMDKLTKLKAQDKGLLQRIKNFIDKWLSKIKEFYSAEGQYITREGELAHQFERFEQLQQLFAEALVDTGENYQSSLTPGEESVVTNESGDPVAYSTEDGSVLLSMRTYEENGRDTLRKYLQKCVSSDKLTKAEMQEMLDGIEDIYQTCKEFKDKYAPFSAWSDAAVVRDTYGKPVFSVVTPNGDYKMNLDFSLVCKKRRTLDQ